MTNHATSEQNLTPEQKHVLALIRDLPLADAVSNAFTEAVSNTLDQRRRDWRNSPERERTLLEALQISQRRAEANRILREARGKWAEANIKPGMMIKVQGTRDGHGMREVISVGHEIVCRQLRTQFVSSTKVAPSADNINFIYGQRRFVMKLASQITTHGFDKVVAYFEPEDNNGEILYRMKKVPK